MPWIAHTNPNEESEIMATVPVIKPTPQPPPASPMARKVQFSQVGKAAGHRIVPYGPGGIGKTTLTTKLPGKTVSIDIDESLARLGSRIENPPLILQVSSWSDLIFNLNSDGWGDVNNVVIDTTTKAEEWALAHTLKTVRTDGKQATSIESYGWGKGYTYVYETFKTLLTALDAHCRAGRNVVLVCHDCIKTVPNPSGEDWIRYEPRLQDPKSGKDSIRLTVREWADHVLFIGYDLNVSKEKKATGSGTRTIYTSEQPFCMAKSRTTNETIPVDDDTDVWAQILK